jgi:hypothetical protein
MGNRFCFALIAAALGMSACTDSKDFEQSVRTAWTRNALPARTPEQTLTAFYDAVNKSDSLAARELSSAERKATMGFLAWRMLMRLVEDGVQFRVDDPKVMAYYEDSTYCQISYNRIEYDSKGDSIRSIRRDYSMDAFIEDGQWVLHSGSDNPFPRMLDENPSSGEFYEGWENQRKVPASVDSSSQ